MLLAVIVLVEVIILEIILGLSNVWFTKFLGDKLPGQYPDKARSLGLIIAWVMRISVLVFYSFAIDSYFTLSVFPGIEFYWIDIVLLLGGTWLIVKTINVMMFETDSVKPHAQLKVVLLQGAFISTVLSVDAVRTAFHYLNNPWIASLIVLAAMLASSILSKKIIGWLRIQTKGLVLLLFSTGILLLLEAFHLPLLSELICFGAALYIMNRFLVSKYATYSNNQTN